MSPILTRIGVYLLLWGINHCVVHPSVFTEKKENQSEYGIMETWLNHFVLLTSVMQSVALPGIYRKATFA